MKHSEKNKKEDSDYVDFFYMVLSEVEQSGFKINNVPGIQQHSILPYDRWLYPVLDSFIDYAKDKSWYSQKNKDSFLLQTLIKPKNYYNLERVQNLVSSINYLRSKHNEGEAFNNNSIFNILYSQLAVMECGKRQQDNFYVKIANGFKDSDLRNYLKQQTYKCIDVMNLNSESSLRSLSYWLSNESKNGDLNENCNNWFKSIDIREQNLRNIVQRRELDNGIIIYAMDYERLNNYNLGNVPLYDEELIQQYFSLNCLNLLRNALNTTHKEIIIKSAINIPEDPENKYPDINDSASTYYLIFEKMSSEPNNFENLLIDYLEITLKRNIFKNNSIAEQINIVINEIHPLIEANRMLGKIEKEVFNVEIHKNKPSVPVSIFKL